MKKYFIWFYFKIKVKNNLFSFILRKIVVIVYIYLYYYNSANQGRNYSFFYVYTIFFDGGGYGPPTLPRPKYIRYPALLPSSKYNESIVIKKIYQ